MPDSILSLINISKSFIQRGSVLDNLSLHVRAGDTIAIMGPSGSGKTTLMNIIGLLDKPDSGEIIFRGNNIRRYNEDESALYRSLNIGFVFQDHLLLPHLTVQENILLPLLARKQTKEDTELKVAHAESLMRKTGISDLGSKYPGTISGGEAQRAALVRALVNNPSILLADEPTGSLDAKNAEIMGELLAEMNREFGLTLILATHSEKLAGKMAQTMILGNGKLSYRSDI
jgi:lipoprotein-releasing system ATP-binding protein